jgi:hypothetical protein
VKTVGAWDGGGLPPGVCLDARGLVPSSRARRLGYWAGPGSPVPSRARRQEIRSVGRSSDGRAAVAACPLARAAFTWPGGVEICFRVFFSHSHFFCELSRYFRIDPGAWGWGLLPHAAEPQCIPLPLAISRRGGEEEEEEEERGGEE